MSRINLSRQQLADALWHTPLEWVRNHCTLKTVLYGLYGVVAASFFFVLMYIGDGLGPMLLEQVETQTGMVVEAEAVNSSLLPPEIELQGLQVKDPKSQKTIFAAGSVRLSPSVFALMTTRAVLDFSVRSLGGTLAGTLKTGTMFSADDIDVRIVGKGVNLTSIPEFSKLLPGASGEVSFTLECSGPPANPDDLIGTLEATAENVKTPAPKPLFKVSNIQLGLVHLSCNLSDSLLKVTEARAAGEKLSASLNGEVSLDFKNIAKSRLDLEGEVSLDPLLVNTRVIAQEKAKQYIKQKRPIPVFITQTIGKPWATMFE